MKINKIILKDIFSFYGESELDLNKFNLILAENGYGKTSLLNSLKLGFGKKFKIDSILNKNSIDNKCYIKIYLDDFILNRSWDFNNNSENLEIFFNDFILNDFEAEQFLNEKFPVELVDFVFFDGEIEKDTILESSNKLKKIFNYFFDLDVMFNLYIDSKKVANNISNKLGNNEILEYIEDQKQLENIEINILELENFIEELQVKILDNQKEIKNIEFKIRSRNSSLVKLENKIKNKEEEIIKLSKIFMDINMYQLPLILNKNLNSILEKEEKIVDILDKNKFEKKLKELESELNIKENILEKFYSIFQTNEKISLNYTKVEFKKFLKSISNLILEKQILKDNYENSKEILKKSDLENLFITLDKLNEKQQELNDKLNDTNHKIEYLKLDEKELLAKIRTKYLLKKERFSKLKAIESLYEISNEAKNLYDLQLKEKLYDFNQLLLKNSKLFMSKYSYKNIYINEKFKFIVDDLDISMLSSGQKQILSFILINTFLDMKNFFEFIFIDTPFGRLSNENREFIFEYYLKFPNLTLLLTTSEFDFIKSKKLTYKKYEIIKTDKGSKIC